MSTYNPQNTVVTVNGVAVTGYGRGEDVIKTVYDSDFVTAEVGVTGETAFVEMNDRRATLTLKLLQTALANDVLSALAEAGTEFSIQITEAAAGGRLLAAGAACRVQKLPDVQRGDALQDVEWNIRISSLIEHVGGQTN